ncbi:MAG: DNA repair protein RadC [Clostridiales bacterium]|nr:DNA repair protein RadC [Clostridiales bacterium]
MEEHAGHRQRLRDRYARAGFDGFAPHEVLELLLTYAIPRRDTKPIARALLGRFGSIAGVLAADKQELMAVNGIGEHAATLLGMLVPLMRVYQQSQQAQMPDLSTPDLRMAYCRALLMGERYERLYVLALDTKGYLLLKSLISAGDEGETAVYPRLIVSALLRAGAAGAVLCHNHPDGNSAPSRADIEMTKALAHMLRPLGIALHDHLIVGADSCLSLAAQGLM